tara:strand:+ start:20 stop:301 length:282 start_codon:yes stop_codon:yes gene_type:complete
MATGTEEKVSAMVILGVVIKAYAAMLFATCLDEAWNMKHPRPYPKAKYQLMQWEYEDFYSIKIKDEWVLRKYRKTDSETKRFIRNQYWEKRNA